MSRVAVAVIVMLAAALVGGACNYGEPCGPMETVTFVLPAPALDVGSGDIGAETCLDLCSVTLRCSLSDARVDGAAAVECSLNEQACPE
jgi:hypothetical protein